MNSPTSDPEIPTRNNYLPERTFERVTVPEDLRDLDIVPADWHGTAAAWRKGQRELVQRIVRSPKKIVMVQAECGTGKSAIGIAAARSTDSNAIVLIQTIQLQEQYMRDFNASMLAGRRHSTCNKTGKGADRAPCTIGIKCDLKGTWDRETRQPITMPTCEYYARKADSVLANVSIQNYAFWLAETSNAGTLFDSRDWIICDEAHELDQICMAAATIHLRYEDLRQLKVGTEIRNLKTIRQYAAWATAYIEPLKIQKTAAEKKILDMGIDIGGNYARDEDAYDTTPEGAIDNISVELGNNLDDLTTTLHRLQRVIGCMEQICKLDPSLDEEWVVDTQEFDNEAQLKPIYGKYGFERIVKAARDKVVLMSAFLAPELLMETLGLDPNDVEVIDTGKVFDRTESKIYYCPVTKLGNKTTPQQWKLLTAVIDRFAGLYVDRPGLVHVPSVSLRDTLTKFAKPATKSRYLTYGQPGTGHPTKDVAINSFIGFSKRGQSPILLGQSISTGLDIPYVPQWQIITKLAFMPFGDPAIAKRKEVDENFYVYHTICQIVQAVGRVKRAPDHNGPTIILDENFGWFYAAHKQHFPAWFRDNLVYAGWQNYAPIASAVSKMDAMLCGLKWTNPVKA